MEEEEEKEKMLDGYPRIISYENIKKIINQMDENICKINTERTSGTGFFCKIPFPTRENMLPVLITNNHIISRNLINKKDVNIEVDIKKEKDTKILNLNNRMKYTDEDYDITIIEIKDTDEIMNYLELDEKITDSIINGENRNRDYIDRTIYVLQYPDGNLSVSFGVVSQVQYDKKWNFYHKCDTKWGSSGSPILSINNKIIGIHKTKITHHNIGTFLDYPIKEFIQMNCFFDKHQNIYEYQLNDLLLKKFDKRFKLDIKGIKIENLFFCEKYLGKYGFEEFKELFIYYKNKYKEEFLDLAFHKIIIKQMEENICKIKIGAEKGTGFFCKIPFPKKENMLPVLITNNDLISGDLINKKDVKIEVDIKKEKDTKILNLNNRMKYADEDYDIAIIELKESDKIQNYLELDEKIIDSIINSKNKNNDYLNETIYIIQNQQEDDLSVSYGIIKYIYQKKIYNFKHECFAHMGTSGSPLLSMNNKIIAIHKIIEKEYKKYNIGTFLNYPIIEFIQHHYYNNPEFKIALSKKVNNKKDSDIPNKIIEKYNLVKQYFGDDIFKELYKMFLHYKLKFSWEEVNYCFNLEFNKKLIDSMISSIFKFEIQNYEGTGFFSKIPFPNKDNMLPVIISCNNLLKEDKLNQKPKNITFKIEGESDIKKIDLESRIIFTNKDYDITIIELKESDKIKNYLELDDKIINSVLSDDDNNNTNYVNSQICIAHYPYINLSISYGVIKNIYQNKKYNFMHNCGIKEGSSGSPIIKENNKVIGLSFEGDIDNYFYKGTFLNYPIKEFIKLNYKDKAETK